MSETKFPSHIEDVERLIHEVPELGRGTDIYIEIPREECEVTPYPAAGGLNGRWYIKEETLISADATGNWRYIRVTTHNYNQNSYI